jgi:hypothetical protein
MIVIDYNKVEDEDKQINRVLGIRWRFDST